jgi:succinoglycan biosynthesis transport protein ExoP
MLTHSNDRGHRTRLSGPTTRLSLLGQVWRHRTLFVAVFCVVFGLAVVALIVLPVRFVATGAVIFAEQEPGISNTSAAWAQKIGDPADLESQLLVVRSPRVLRLAMAAPGVRDAVLEECRHSAARGGLGLLLGGASSCDKLEADSDALVDYVQSRYIVGAVGRSRVINISYQSPLADVARTMANALVTAFLDDQRANISTGREVAAAWLWREAEQLNTALRDEDARIQAYRREKGLMRGTYAPITSERLTSISQQLSAAEAARSEAAARLQEIKTDQARGSADSPSVLASRSVADLKQQISTSTAQLAMASESLGPMHPTRRALQREYDGLQQRLAREIASVAASAQKIYIAADSLVTSLKQQMEAAKAEVATATADEASIESMVRSAEIKRQQYSELYKRASELETERRVLLGSTRLVNLAELPNKPFFPKRVPFLAAGLTFGFMLAFAAVLLRERSSRGAPGASGFAWSTTFPKSGTHEFTLAKGRPLFVPSPESKKRRGNTSRGFFSSLRTDLPIGATLKQGGAN